MESERSFNSVPAEKTHHEFASGIIKLFLDLFHLLHRTQCIP